jgi:carboxylesterase
VLDDCYHIETDDRQRHLVVEAIDSFAGDLIGKSAPAIPARVLRHSSAA